MISTGLAGQEMKADEVGVDASGPADRLANLVLGVGIESESAQEPLLQIVPLNEIGSLVLSVIQPNQEHRDSELAPSERWNLWDEHDASMLTAGAQERCVKTTEVNAVVGDEQAVCAGGVLKLGEVRLFPQPSLESGEHVESALAQKLDDRSIDALVSVVPPWHQSSARFAWMCRSISAWCVR